MKTEFFLPMREIPTNTAQEKGVNWAARKIFTTPELRQVEAKYKAALAQHRPETPFTGPIALMVMWHFPITGKHVDGEWKTSKPDTDNLLKLFKDCMTQLGFWMDDAQVCYEVQLKKYASVTGVYVSVQELEGKN